VRLCRFFYHGANQLGLYDERGIVALPAGAAAYTRATGRPLELVESDDLLDFLPPVGQARAACRRLAEWVAGHRDVISSVALDPATVELLVPIPRPNKLLLLAGNYAEHVVERGGVAAERAETFPYVFMKPPSTTLTNPGVAIRLPAVSPTAIDWELELGVVIGRRAKNVSESDALAVVAGYTVINDISNRRYRPNPERKLRERDKFFDWMHGKWHDGFCPCGPALVSADAVPDPQALSMSLHVNGREHQHGSTASMVFPVAAIIAFISQMMTLEPGDIISTGTPSGVGSATNTFLAPGDRIEARIEGIGTLVTPVVAESVVAE